MIRITNDEYTEKKDLATVVSCRFQDDDRQKETQIDKWMHYINNDNESIWEEAHVLDRLYRGYTVTETQAEKTLGIPRTQKTKKLYLSLLNKGVLRKIKVNEKDLHNNVIEYDAVIVDSRITKFMNEYYKDDTQFYQHDLDKYMCCYSEDYSNYQKLHMRRMMCNLSQYLKNKLQRMLRRETRVLTYGKPIYNLNRIIVDDAFIEILMGTSYKSDEELKRIFDDNFIGLDSTSMPVIITDNIYQSITEFIRLEKIGVKGVKPVFASKETLEGKKTPSGYRILFDNYSKEYLIHEINITEYFLSNCYMNSVSV